MSLELGQGGGIQIEHGSGGGGGGSPWNITDGVHSVTGVGLLTVTGGTVGGTTPNATLSITGSGIPYPATPGIAIMGASTWGTSITDNHSNWDNAYGWGNWASNFGTTIGTIAQGNDSRINHGETAYGWGNWASNFGTTIGTIAQGNDSRILDGETSYGWGQGLRLDQTTPQTVINGVPTFNLGIILSNITAGYLPFCESSDNKLVQSPIYTDYTNVSIGSTSPSAQFEVMSEGTAGTRGIMIGQHNTGSQTAKFVFQKSRGTKVSPTAVANGDTIGQQWGQPYDGTNYFNVATMSYVVDGAVSTGNVPTGIYFALNPAGVTSFTGPDALLRLNSDKTITMYFGSGDNLIWKEFPINLSGYGLGTADIPVVIPTAVASLPGVDVLLSDQFACFGGLSSITNNGVASGGLTVHSFQAYDFNTSAGTVNGNAYIDLDTTNGGWKLSGGLTCGGGYMTVSSSAGEIITSGDITGSNINATGGTVSGKDLSINDSGSFGGHLTISNVAGGSPGFGIRVYNMPTSDPADGSSTLWADPVTHIVRLGT